MSLTYYRKVKYASHVLSQCYSITSMRSRNFRMYSPSLRYAALRLVRCLTDLSIQHSKLVVWLSLKPPTSSGHYSSTGCRNRREGWIIGEASILEAAAAFLLQGISQRTTHVTHMVERYILFSSFHLLLITTNIYSWSICIKLRIKAITVLKRSTRSPLIIIRRYFMTTVEYIHYKCSISKADGYSLLWTRDTSQSEVRAPAGAQLSSSPQSQGQLLSGGIRSVSTRRKL
jgi:hypothetical protein